MTLTILRPPSLAPTPAVLTPARSPFSSTGAGPSPLFDAVPIQDTKTEGSIPRQPTVIYSEQDIYNALGQTDLSPELDDQIGLVQPVDDDILLPFTDRTKETREVLEKPINKGLYTLLASDPTGWAQINAILSINREVMPVGLHFHFYLS